jgi:Bacterial Ig-like domain (group 3)/IPT/TIG domain/Pentapeptide repeats (8 copies)
VGIVRRRPAFLIAAIAVAILLAVGVLQSVPGVARAATGPVVTGISLPSGPEAGGTSVTVTGSGFTGATAVDFGTAGATSWKVNSDTSVTAVAPATTMAGPVDVTVTTPDGTSATGAADQFYYADEYSASSGTDVDNLGPQVTAADGSGNQIDIPYYIKPAGDYALDSEDDGSGLNSLVPHLLNLSGGTPKDEWPLWAGFGGPVNTFVGTDLCDSEPWPFHTTSYPLDLNCWEMGIDASQNDLTTGLWDVWVPTTIMNASGQTLYFVGFSGDKGYANDAQTGQCDSGDVGYVENWPGAGSATPGVPGAFTGGEEFNVWGSGSVEAQYAPQSAGTTAPLIEFGAQQYGRPSEFDCQWYQQNAVVAPQFSCVDQDGSGVASCAATAGVTADGDLDTSTPGGHTLTITATDNDGNTRTLSVNYFIGQAPTITVTADPAAPSSTGWYNASQLGAGNSLPVTVTISPNPSDDSLDTASCTLDNNGTQSTIWSFDSGPNNPDTTADNVPATFSNPGTVTLEIPQGVSTLSCTAADLSGETTTTPTYTYQVDTNTPPQTNFWIPPQLTGNSTPVYTCDGVSSFDGAEPATYALGQQVSLEWTLNDDVSGLPAGSAIVSPDVSDSTNGFATGYTTLNTSQAGSQETPAAATVDAAGDVTTGQECPYYVEQGTTTTQVSASANPSDVGQQVTFTATVSPQAPATAITPTGTVTFSDGSTSLGTGTLLNGIATLTTGSLGVGQHSITASYAGDDNFNGSASTALTETVNFSATTVTITTSPNPSTVGTQVTYTATVSPVPTDGGTVKFTDNGTAVSGCAAQPVSSTGTAICTTAPNTVGAHNITATFSGTGTFAASTSATVTQIVTSTPCATLAGCNLHGLNLSGAQLAGTNLTGANLNGAILAGADLAGANLTDANLNKADLTSASLSEATVTGANFNKVTWSKTTCPDGTNSSNDGGTCASHL